MDSSKSKHIFNTVFFGILALILLIYFLPSIVGIVGHILNPSQNEFMTSSILLVYRIIFLVFSLVAVITFIFHLIAFYRCDLSAKPFNTEFLINRIVVIVAIIGYLLILISPILGMGMGIPAVICVFAVITSAVIFFKGFFRNKN